MTHRILITDPIPTKVIQTYQNDSNLKFTLLKNKISSNELKEYLTHFDGVLVRTATRLTKNVLSGSSLKVIGRAGVGLDNIDLKTASELGIAVFNAPNGNTISTAEYTFGLLLSIARWIPQAHIDVTQNQHWNRKKWQGVDLFQKKIAIIGFGRIGQALARRCVAFGMEILVYDPFIDSKTAHNIPHKKLPLKNCLNQADFISLHVPLNNKTQGLINQSKIDQMKPGVRIINASRGGVIDEQSLTDALNNGKIAAAAVDVYSKEPPFDPPSPLLKAPRCLCLPHLGAATTEARIRVAQESLEQIIKYLHNGDIAKAVNTNNLKV